jgi:hypothetical protein
MMSIKCLLAAHGAPTGYLGAALQNLSGSTSGLAVLLIAVMAVTLLVVIWAAFLRKRHKPVTGWHMHYSGGPTGKGSGEAGRRGRRRRRQRDHRPRNPTLAETGGLPPARPEQPPESAL